MTFPVPGISNPTALHLPMAYLSTLLYKRITGGQLQQLCGVPEGAQVIGAVVDVKFVKLLNFDLRKC
jgi:hypothetical protein